MRDIIIEPFIRVAAEIERKLGRRVSVTVEIDAEIFDHVAAEYVQAAGLANIAAVNEVYVHPSVTLRRAAKMAEPDRSTPLLTGPLVTFERAARCALRTGRWPSNVALGTAGVEPPDPLRSR